MNTKKIVFSSLIGIGAIVAFIGMFLDAIMLTISAMGKSVSTGTKFLDLMTESTGASNLMKVMGPLGMIFGIIAIVLAFALVVFAVLNILNKGEFKKVNLILAIATIVAALISFVSICVLGGEVASIAAILNPTVMPAIGSFMILIGSAVAGTGALLNIYKK